MMSLFNIKSCRHENLIYLAVWGLLFGAPLLTEYVRATYNSDFRFDWTEVFIVWRRLAVYFVLFIFHNILLATLIFHKRRIILYFSSVIILLSIFITWQYYHKPPKMAKRPPMEQNVLLPLESLHMRPNVGRPPMPPPHPVDPHVLDIVVLMLIFGANFGIKVYFRSRSDRQRLAELEKQDVERQLEYLRCQINPHFFMNTLNNIHALVDIDPDQAKWAICNFSKMMRFVLYEGNRSGVLLAYELDFVRHYVELMQLRYTNKVHIDVELPDEVPNLLIPPMILITFIENAFKHGISYQHDSFVDVKVVVKDEWLQFVCRNSKNDTSIEKRGLGLVNVNKRLNLLYDNRYTLNIKDDNDIYIVELIIPLKNENPLSCN